MKFVKCLCIIFALVTVGCDELKQALGKVVVSVENATTLDGFDITANGEKRFTLDSGEKKTFSVDGSGTGSIRVVASHPAVSSDLTFTVITSGDDGGSAALLLSTETVVGQQVVRFTCPGCESIFGLNEGTPTTTSTNPVK